MLIADQHGHFRVVGAEDTREAGGAQDLALTGRRVAPLGDLHRFAVVRLPPTSPHALPAAPPQ